LNNFGLRRSALVAGLGAGLLGWSGAALAEEHAPAAEHGAEHAEAAEAKHEGAAHEGAAHEGAAHEGAAHEGKHEGAHEEEEHEEPIYKRFEFALTGVLLSPQVADSHLLYGGAVGVEYDLTRLLRLELGAKLLKSAEETAVPVDLLLKLAFHATHELHPYLGVGPGVVLSKEAAVEGSTEAPAWKTHFAIAAVGGAHYWFSEYAGVQVQLDYNLVFADKATSELGGELGLVFHL
jgi:opacity protein-like surface antigen